MTSFNFKFRLSYLVAAFVGLIVVGLGLALISLAVIYPNLPALDVLTDYHPKMPLRVYTADGALIGEYGVERRKVVRIESVPVIMKQAILAAEDDRFYEHSGVDILGVIRALVVNVLSGGRKQGASTITQQVARNFFLTSEKTYTRKLYEMMLAFKIENNLSKDEILELYMNQIYLGQRAHGFASAARIYFGKPLEEVSLAEAAMLSGLPKSPSRNNPVANPKRARQRQVYILGRMHNELGYISKEEYEQAVEERLIVRKKISSSLETNSEYIAEMVRRQLIKLFPDDVYTRGLRAHTTILIDEQKKAYRALRKGVMDYDRRHGYRGPEGFVKLTDASKNSEFDDLLQPYPDYDDLLPALVLEATKKAVKVYKKDGKVLNITGRYGLGFAAPMLDKRVGAQKRIRRGSIVRVQKVERTIQQSTPRSGDKGKKETTLKTKVAWRIVQLPEVEAAFVAIDPKSGKLRALVGGFDFWKNKFNHVTQALRQPGSSFKPFIYSAALEKGINPSTLIDDSPFTARTIRTGGELWEPKNSDGKYYGPMTVIRALTKSRNMVSIRILDRIGSSYAQDYATRFGFDPKKHPPVLTLALGAGLSSPWNMVRAYSVFSNGGYLLEPFLISKVTDSEGKTLVEYTMPESGSEAHRVIDARNSFLMDHMLRKVTTSGTAYKASVALKRRDIAGKTGTTNDAVDAWFCGYQKTVAACAWVGFDKPKTLGKWESGGRAAMPIWVDYMRSALQNVPKSYMSRPEGILTYKGNLYYDGGDGKPEFPDPEPRDIDSIIQQKLFRPAQPEVQRQPLPLPPGFIVSPTNNQAPSTTQQEVAPILRQPAEYPTPGIEPEPDLEIENPAAGRSAAPQAGNTGASNVVVYPVAEEVLSNQYENRGNARKDPLSNIQRFE